jgi:hypothetical protein
MNNKAMMQYAQANQDQIKGAGSYIGKKAYENREVIANYAYDNREVIA